MSVTLAPTGACLLLIAALVLHGPRIRRVELDTKKLVTQSGQRIVLRANQPLAQIDTSAVTLEPKAKFSVVTAGDAIVLQLQDQLAYNTTYNVRVQGLKGQRSSKTADYSYTFKTQDATLYYIKRNHGTDLYGIKSTDQIIRRGLHSRQETVLFEADRIKEFILLDGAIVVSTISESGKIDTLQRVELATRETEPVIMSVGTVSELHASPNGQDFGYIFAPKDKYTSELKLYSSKTKLTFNIYGIDKKPLAPAYWSYAPDGTAGVAQIPGVGTQLIDTSGRNKPVPLGYFDRLFGFSRDGSQLLLGDMDGLVTLNTQTRERTVLEPTKFDNDTAYPDIGLLLSNIGKDVTLQQALIYGLEGMTNHVFVKSGSTVKRLYARKLNEGSLVGLSASSNSQYASIEIGARDGEYDQYPGNAKPKDVSTEIVDISSGDRVDRIEGFGIIWD